MKDPLEKFITENRDAFDLYSPDEKLWNRISTGRRRKNDFQLLIRISIRVAAAILIFTASYVFHEYRDRNRGNELRAENEIYIQIPELKETEYYYNNLVSLKLKELEPFFANIPGLEDELKTDLSELDNSYSELKKDLKDNIANDQVIEAMIQNYRLKIKILEDLLSEIKNENASYENEEFKYPV